MDALEHAFTEHLAATNAAPLGLRIASAEGCYLITDDGTRYLDLVAGLAVNNIGHRHPAVIAAIKAQCDRYLHVIPYGEFIQEPQVRFAKRLSDLLPPELDQVYFVNSGTEAIEGAMKLAKRVTGRTRMIACHKSYHGSTHGALSITGNEVKKYRNRPLLPDVHFITFNDTKELELITEEVACVVIEPIQGDAGVRVPSKAWMHALRERCTRTGALLVLDEVQTGFGRTGPLFAFERTQTVPDILVLGKALGGGVPMGAFVAGKERMVLLSHDPPLGHITTFGGHPLPCVAGLAALEVLLAEKLPQHAMRMGGLFRELLVHERILEVRGEGLMMAMELGDEALVQGVVHGALGKGILLFWFLSCPTAVRIAPPLNISEEQVRHACAVILEVLSENDRPI